MENMYEAPETEPKRDEPDARELGRGYAIAGLLCFYAPFVSAAIVLFLLVSSVAGSASEARVTVRVEDSLWILALGFFVGLVGVFLMLVALLQKHNREPWFFWCTLSASLMWCFLLLPVGPLVGVVVLVIFLFRREEFLDSSLRMQGGIEHIPEKIFVETREGENGESE